MSERYAPVRNVSKYFATFTGTLTPNDSETPDDWLDAYNTSPDEDDALIVLVGIENGIILHPEGTAYTAHVAVWLGDAWGFLAPVNVPARSQVGVSCAFQSIVVGRSGGTEDITYSRAVF
jgi:hypothetical protein